MGSIAWTALEAGTPIAGSDGERIGTVARVVGDQARDIFSGLTFKDGLLGPERLVPADLVADISEQRVALTISREQAAALEVYEP